MDDAVPVASRPRVSVVIPVRDGAELLPRAIASVAGQGFADLEIVVIDDGSHDATPEVLAAHDEPRLRSYRLPPSGVSAARNAGVDRARGEWVAFLDADDEALPDWIETLVGPLGEETGGAEVGLVCCGVSLLGAGAPERRALPIAGGRIHGDRDVLFLAGSFLVRRDLFLNVSGYEEELTYSENTELGIRLTKACGARGLSIVAIPRPLVRYHQRPPPIGAAAEPLHRRRLDAVRFLLERHADVFARDRSSRETHLALAGVLAARLGRMSEARGYFLDALRTRPGRPIHLARWAASWVPGLGRRIWSPGAG